MRFYTQAHQHYCGIDLHAKTMYVCIVNQQGDHAHHGAHRRCRRRRAHPQTSHAVGPVTRAYLSRRSRHAMATRRDPAVDLSPRAGYRLNACPGGCARPSAINNPSFQLARRQLQPNDALSNSPGIDTTLLDPAPVFVANFSGPSELELSTQRDRISYPYRPFLGRNQVTICRVNGNSLILWIIEF